MRLLPPEPEIGPEDGFCKADLFGYADFGERLANLVRGVDERMVLVLDGPWGSGKSIFAKQWAGHLRNQGVPVIEFDAFACDHQEDAFLLLGQAIVKEARAVLPKSDKTLETFINGAKAVGRHALPAAAKVGLRAVTFGVLSSENLDGMAKDVREAVEGAASDVQQATEDYLVGRLDSVLEEQETQENFKQTLSNLAANLASKKQAANPDYADSAAPLVFLVDDLDRCRPSFALELVERMKHLFSVTGVVFVLVTHLPQLEAIAENVYGTRQGAQYLRKFYDLRVVIPKPAKQDLWLDYTNFLWAEMQLGSGDTDEDAATPVQWAALARANGLSLRDIGRIATVLAAIRQSRGAAQTMPPPLLIGLAAMRMKNQPLFERAARGALEWDEELKEFLGLKGGQARNLNLAPFGRWWRFATQAKRPTGQWATDYATRIKQDFDLERRDLQAFVAETVESFE